MLLQDSGSTGQTDRPTRTHDPSVDAAPTTGPGDRTRLAGRTVVEQAKGLLREVLDVPVEEAFTVLRAYSHANGQHLTELSRQLMNDRYTRPVLIAEITQFAQGSVH